MQQVSGLKLSLSILVFMGWMTSVFAQPVGVGQWRDFLPYGHVEWVAQADDRVYAATPFSLFSFGLEDGALERINTITGLSDIGINVMRYHEPTGFLIVGYSNGNLDLISKNEVVNLSDIKRNTTISPKTIHNILFIGEEIYLACGFGIIQLNINTETSTEEIKETFFIGDLGSQLEVFDLAYDGTRMYATTDEGIMYADYNNPNISTYLAWSTFPQLPYASIDHYDEIDHFDGKVYANYRSELFNNDSMIVYDPVTDQWQPFLNLAGLSNQNFEVSGNEIIVSHADNVTRYNANWEPVEVRFDYGTGGGPSPRHAQFAADGSYWIADRNQGMIHSTGPFNGTVIQPEGPPSVSSSRTRVINGEIWIAPGFIIGQKSSAYNSEGMFRQTENGWSKISKLSDTLLNNVHDIVNLAVHPNRDDVVYAAGFGAGLVQIIDGKVTNVFNQTNTILQEETPNNPDFNWCGVRGLAFDQGGNLWITNNKVQNQLVVLKNDGTWQSFDFGSVFSNNLIGDVIVTGSGNKWMVLPRAGLLVFNENGTIDNKEDDSFKLLNSAAGSGGLPSPTVFSIAEDRDGEIWVGTDLGVAVFYSPESVFSGSIDAQQILIQQDGQTKILLETETVTSIAIDGADRKWLGTEKAGAFLMSPDGTEEILHFTAENSPLLSNNIQDITVHPESGEVLFSTDAGLIAYRGTATEGGVVCDDVYAYPNPVPPGYTGTISVAGLIQNSVVRITDVAGNLVYETVTDGGQAVWDGRSMNGDSAKTGVYLVFCSDPLGQNTCVSKILLVD